LKLNVVDSSGWLEYFADGPNADFFAPPLEKPDLLIVPSISLLEVFKRILHQRGENEALQAMALMMEGRVVDLDADLALRAAMIGLSEKLPLADSVMLATAQKFGALLWTQDGDFENLAGVRFIKKFS
jgi:predicted nucleic acid-binding protein